MAGAPLFTFGYVRMYDRTYSVQGVSRTRQEPPQILMTAKSVRLLRPAAPVDDRADRAGTAFEVILLAGALLASAYIWSRRKRADATHPPPNSEPPERGSGVRF